MSYALDPEVLLTRIGEYRDKTAFAALFGEFAPKLKAYARQRGCPDEVAEKVAVDTMVAAWLESPARRYDGTSPGTWLFRLLARQLTQRQRPGQNSDAFEI